MKKILTIALVLLMSVCCLVSCDKIEQEIGKTVSVAAVDVVADKLAEQGVAYESWSEEQLAEAAEEWKAEFGTEMVGELTSALQGNYENDATGAWVEYYVYGFSSTDDANKFEEYLNEEFADEIEEQKAIIINGGFIVGLTYSNVAINIDEIPQLQ